MKLMALMIVALSLISTTLAQGQHTQTGRKSEPMQTMNDITMVAPALEKYAQGPLADLWKRPGLTPRDRSIVTVASLIARNQTIEMPYYFNLALDNDVNGSVLCLTDYTYGPAAGPLGTGGERPQYLRLRFAAY
jgi:4-carboxymuconolactone decarboxylase